MSSGVRKRRRERSWKSKEGKALENEKEGSILFKKAIGKFRSLTTRMPMRGDAGCTLGGSVKSNREREAEGKCIYTLKRSWIGGGGALKTVGCNLQRFSPFSVSSWRTNAASRLNPRWIKPETRIKRCTDFCYEQGQRMFVPPSNLLLYPSWEYAVPHPKVIKENWVHLGIWKIAISIIQLLCFNRICWLTIPNEITLFDTKKLVVFYFSLASSSFSLNMQKLIACHALHSTCHRHVIHIWRWLWSLSVDCRVQTLEAFGGPSGEWTLSWQKHVSSKQFHFYRGREQF